MSTRAIIARAGKNEGEFLGVYHHWNGMPTHLGKFLFDLRDGHFKGDLAKMLRVLIDDHSAWSNIFETNFRLKPGFSSDHKKKQPMCYCHGERSEVNQRLTHKSICKGTDIEWAYIFDEEKNRMYVRDVRYDAESVIELNEPEPDWNVISCGENFERCTHYAWFHKLLPKTSNLSTQTWLGNQPLEFHDAIGFIINGTRYASTGTGGNSDYYNRTSGARWPRNSWIASVKAKNGRQMDFPVALINGQEYVPAPNVAWVYPPTKANPSETLVASRR